MGIRKWPAPGVVKSGGFIDTDQLGSGKGSPRGKKFLTDNQTFTNVDATQVDSGAAPSGYALTADGAGGATWAAAGATYTIREYTANDTWTKPSNLSAAIVLCVSGGGGAGVGRRGAAGTNRGGGGAGTGGHYSWQTFLAADLGATESVTVGGGGGGATGITTDDTNGSAGAAGGAGRRGEAGIGATWRGSGGRGQGAGVRGKYSALSRQWLVASSYILVTAACLYTHYFTIFLLQVQGCALRLEQAARRFND